MPLSCGQPWFSCLVEALDEFVEKGKDRMNTAEASGILTNIQKFSPSFIVLLATFDSILGLIKPLFEGGRVLKSTSGRDQTMLSTYQSYKVIYFKAIDKVLVELQHHFEERRPILQSIAALSPRSPTFLESSSCSLLSC